MELFEKDCQTSIPGNLINTTQEYHGRYSVNEDYHYRWTRFDPKELEGSVLHNQVTWEVEICAVASLVDSPDVSTEDILSFPFFEGAPVSSASWIPLIRINVSLFLLLCCCLV